MIRNTIQHALTTLCLVALCGCAYTQGTKVPDNIVASFTKGSTTKDEVVSALGGPQDLKLEGGKQILVYKYQKIAGMPFDKNEGSDTMFIFNDKGILEEILKSKGSSLPNPLTGR